jgi:hypothetical protein
MEKSVEGSGFGLVLGDVPWNLPGGTKEPTKKVM